MKQKQYDIAVIGSGMAGMCLAALMANAGHRTLVVEKLSLMGGRFSTMEYRGYRISTGGVAIQRSGPVAEIFEEVGAELPVRYVNDTSYHIEGKFHMLPEKGRTERLMSLVCPDENEIKRVMKVIRLGIKWMEPSASINFRDWLSQYTQNDKILKIFQSNISGLAMVNADELPANEYFRILKSSSWVGAGMGIAPSGNITLMESLAKIIKSRGGDVLTDCPAKKILIENGTATGILVQHREEEIKIAAKAVVSNVGPGKTVDLGGVEHFDKGYVMQLSESGPPTAQAWIWIESSRPLMETSLAVILDARRINSCTCLTQSCPELAPAGRHLYVAGASPFSSTLSVDFREETELCIQDLRDVLPGFDKYAEILLPQYFRKEWPGYRAISGRGMPEKTPVMNLYNVGDGIAVPGVTGTVGTNACAMSARAVAKDLMKRLG